MNKYEVGRLSRVPKTFCSPSKGTSEADKSVAQTVINTSTVRSKTLAFNYASEALNNSFFLDMLVRQLYYYILPRELIRVTHLPGPSSNPTRYEL